MMDAETVTKQITQLLVTGLLNLKGLIVFVSALSLSLSCSSPVLISYLFICQTKLWSLFWSKMAEIIV